MINFKVVGFILGVLLIIEGAFILFCSPVSLFYGDADWVSIFLSGFVTIFCGFILWASFRTCNKAVGKREGYLVVTLGWVVFSIFGAFPFFMSGGIPSYTDSFFETMSGFTTTGASILNGEQIEALSHGLLFWRSLTQWLGGMGIIVLSLVILPVLGIGGMQLFVAEVPGPTPDKLHPRVKETAKRLWGVYCLITLLEVLLLWAGEMNLFEAVNHSFTTMATGGYSIKGDSIGYYQSPYIHYIVSLFMIVAGINFSLSYLAMHFKFKPIWKNEELRWYLGFIIGFTLIITLVLMINQSEKSLETNFRDSLFQVSSIITTTGFATTNYMHWIPSAWVVLLILMFFGGSAGSTGGSIKIVRIVLLLKNGFLELKRLIHPNAIIPVRFDKLAVSQQVITNVLAFVSVYIILTAASTLVISFIGHDFETSLGAVAATLGNIGPGIGKVGPADNYAFFSSFGKWFLSALMLIGRLELFTVLVLFTGAFWKK
ncbi:MAG: TrkH family potassium uptake protein [Bacteroidales bacterium]|nr:TrkH family potassium uptake protein [Bacteroidales bacterium]